MNKNIVVDVPHDGTSGYDIAKDYLSVDEQTLSGGRDFGAREIFLGHEWALHEVVGECYRDLMDLNRVPRDSSPDGRFKTHGMCLDGSPPGVELWKSARIPGDVKIELQGLGRTYKLKLMEALNDTRARLILFGHTMPHLGSGSSTSELAAGDTNALVSIGNGGDKDGEGSNLLLPAEQAQFLRKKIETLLSQELGDDLLSACTKESGDVVSLNDYSGRASAKRYTPKSDNKRPSVLIEFNRSLIGHAEDPMFEALNQRGLKIDPVDRKESLHKIIGQALKVFQDKYLY